VRIVAEYRTNADECRKLAKLMPKPDDRETLERMAQTWEKLAKDHERDLEEPDTPMSLPR
jgi:hypothetical protein